MYTVLDWYTIEDATVVFHMQNRRDNPDPDGPPYFDFAGLSVATYAGDGKWAGEEDFWDLSARGGPPPPTPRRARRWASRIPPTG